MQGKQQITTKLQQGMAWVLTSHDSRMMISGISAICNTFLE